MNNFKVGDEVYWIEHKCDNAFTVCFDTIEISAGGFAKTKDIGWYVPKHILMTKDELLNKIREVL